MSLSLPYVLAAAAAATPDRPVAVRERTMTCAELAASTSDESQRLLRQGYRPEDALCTPTMATVRELIRALGAVRIGMLLTRRDVPAPTRHEPTADAEVAMTQVWSETPAAELDEARGLRVLSHGDVLVLARTGGDERRPAGWLEPLVEVVSAVMGETGGPSGTIRPS